MNFAVDFLSDQLYDKRAELQNLVLLAPYS